MSGVVPVSPRFQFSSTTGVALAGGSVDIYLAGTTTRSNSWQDRSLTSLNTNPIELDSSGSCSIFVADDKTYKLVVKNSAGVVQSHLGGDNVVGASSQLALATALAAALVDIEDARVDALADVQVLVDAADTSEAACAAYAAAAATGAVFYDTIALGLAAVASGVTFGVKAGGSDGLARPTIYRDDAGVATLLYAVVPGSEFDTMKGQIGGSGVITDLGPLVTPVVQENITNGSAIAYTATYESGGTRINQTTASLLAVYQSRIAPGGELCKITQTVTITTGGSAAGVGLSFGTDSSRLTVYYKGDGTLNSMAGEDVVTSTRLIGISTWTVADTFTLEYLLDKDGNLTVSVQKGSGKKSYWHTTGVSLGRVDYAIFGQCNALISCGLSAVSPVGQSRVDKAVDEYGVAASERADMNALTGMLEIFQRSQPADITATLPLYLKAYKKTSLREFFTSIDLQPPTSIYDPRLALVYVDYATGVDTNAGTATAPLKTLPAAQAAIKKTKYATIMVKGGRYLGPSNAFDTVNQSFENHTLQIISWDGEPVYSSPHMATDTDPAITWSLVGGTTYSADCSGHPNGYFGTFGVAGVLDSSASQLTSDGDYAVLTAAASLVACQATPGTYFRDAAVPNTINVNLTDGRAPDADCRVFAAQWGAGSFGSNTNNAVCYLEGIRFEGGTYPFRIAPTTTQDITFYAKDCWFRHGFTGDALPIVACGTFVLQNCLAARGFADGFSYTKFSTGPAQLAVEIDCIARNNGRTTGLTNQGSTSHTGGTVVRVNGEYFDNQHANIHDVSGCKSWFLGVNAHDPKSATAVCNIGVGQSGVDTDIAYLDTCTTTGFATDLIVGTGCFAYYSDFIGSTGNTVPTKTGAGTTTTYTP